MTDSNGTASIATETNVRFHRLVSDELESVLLDKQRYDHEYPGNVKEFSKEQLWNVARVRVLRRLCAPFCDADDDGCAENMFWE